MATIPDNLIPSLAFPLSAPPSDWTVADLLEQLGNIPAGRVHMTPFPGTATEKDVIELETRGERLCELVDGTLVEKPMGAYESWLAVRIIMILGPFVERNNLGVVFGKAALLRLLPGKIRAADVTFIRHQGLPEGHVPREAVPAIVPTLAIEVISRSNTKREMDHKLSDYFSAGVELVWYIYPETQTAVAYTAADQSVEVGCDEVLEGGDVLPGFKLPLRQLFTEKESI